MTDEDGNEPLIVKTYDPLLARVIFALLGLFIIGIVVWELHPVVLWPISWITPFFLVILGGGILVGSQVLTGGLFGWSDEWTIRRGRIDLVRRNPFTSRQLSFARPDISAIEVVKRQDMDNDDYWCVELAMHSGERFTISQSALQKNSEKFREDVIRRLDGS